MASDTQHTDATADDMTKQIPDHLAYGGHGRPCSYIKVARLCEGDVLDLYESVIDGEKHRHEFQWKHQVVTAVKRLSRFCVQINLDADSRQLRVRFHPSFKVPLVESQAEHALRHAKVLAWMRAQIPIGSAAPRSQ